MFFRRASQIDSKKIIVIGAGEVGYDIARRLAGENKFVVVIDHDPEALRRIEDSMDVQTILGSGASPTVLTQAGTAGASIVLAVTSSDNINLLACMFANVMAPGAIKLARIREADYTLNSDILTSAALNISLLVNPDDEIVRMIDRLLSLPGALEYGEFANGRLRFVGIVVEEGPLLGQPLKRFREITQDTGIMVGAIARDQRILVPSGDDFIKKNDLVYFVYRSASQKNLLAALNRSRNVFSSVCIVGGGSIGLKFAQRLEGKNIRVKLFERDEQG
jgi:trk system potassium uptake protein TrkA